MRMSSNARSVRTPEAFYGHGPGGQSWIPPGFFRTLGMAFRRSKRRSRWAAKMRSVELTIWDSYRFRAPEGHGGIPRLNEIGDCPKELAFDHRQEASKGQSIPFGVRRIAEGVIFPWRELLLCRLFMVGLGRCLLICGQTLEFTGPLFVKAYWTHSMSQSPGRSYI